MLGIQALDEVDRLRAIRDENQITINGVFLKSFADEPGIGRIIFDQENTFCLPARLRLAGLAQAGS